MKRRYNYHTHTYRCGHAQGSDEDFVKAAIKAGYEILGFSDHAPYREYQSPRQHMDWSQLDDYIASILSLKEKYAGIIDIRLGLESEYYEDDHDERAYLKDRVEFYLLGQHFQKADGSGSYFRTCSDEEIMLYAEQVSKGLDSGLFDYLCHPDVYLSRQETFNEACRQAAHLICQKAAATDTPLEVNVRGVMKGRRTYKEGQFYQYPHRGFWEIAAQYPVRCIIGVDAHDPEDLLDLTSYEQALEELDDLHLNYLESL